MDPNSLSQVFPAFVHTGYLGELDTATVTAVLKSAMKRCLQPGEIAFLEGQPCAGLYIVETGWLKEVKTSPLGREQIIRLAGPGEMLNEIGILVGGTNLVTVQALEFTRVWIIERQKMQDLMEQYPPLCELITRTLAGRVLHLLQLVEDLSLRNVKGRLARLLLERSKEDVLERQRWSTQAEMAAYIGTTAEVINRVLNDLAEAGYIHIERHKIQILDRCGLMEDAKADYK